MEPIQSKVTSKGQILLHALHLGEMYCIIHRERGKADADLSFARIKNFPVTLLDTIDEVLLLTAASFKSEFPISCAAALCKIHNAVLLTGDTEFEILEKKGAISVHWLNS